MGRKKIENKKMPKGQILAEPSDFAAMQFKPVIQSDNCFTCDCGDGGDNGGGCDCVSCDSCDCNQ